MIAKEKKLTNRELLAQFSTEVRHRSTLLTSIAQIGGELSDFMNSKTPRPDHKTFIAASISELHRKCKQWRRCDRRIKRLRAAAR